MGRRAVKTYGRHRQRVIAVDVWNDAVDKDKHVFSTSSSMDSLSLQSSCNNSSLFQPTRNTRPKRNVINKENSNPRTRAGRRGVPRQNYRECLDSGSSTGGDSLTSSRPRRALQDCKNQNNPPKTYGKRKRNVSTLLHYSLCKNKAPLEGSSVKEGSISSVGSVYNFSEFDDYSLVISGSPQKSPCSLRSGKKLTTSIETSTPCAKRHQASTPLSARIRTSDLSHIENLGDSPISVDGEDSVDGSSNARSSTERLGRLGISSIMVQSPSLEESKRGEISSVLDSKGADTLDSPSSNCVVQLEKLRQSFISMHVSSRSKSKSNFDNSASLFGSKDEIDSDCLENAEEEEDEDESYGEEDSVDNLSDIDEIEEEEGSLSEVEIYTDSNSSEEGHNDSTHFMLADNSYLRTSKSGDQENICLSIIHSRDQSEYCSIESEAESSAQSYHTAHSDYGVVNTSDTVKKIIKDKKTDLNESVFSTITPSKRKSDVSLSPRSKVYQVCQQQEGVSFRRAIPDRMMKMCKKIGEGVYGEVFRTKNNGEFVAIKIIPIEGDFSVNDERQKNFEEILPEIVISRELSCLNNNEDCFAPNFCQVNRVSCVQGAYPDELLELWDKYHEQRQSENDRPDVFDDDQLFIVFEFADGGTDLESCQFNNISEAKSVLMQVAFSLAVAEESLSFEHRDLHWGNVLVKRTDQSHMEYKLLSHDYSIESRNVKACIIDFTLSRLTKDGCTVYNDLGKDESLFEGKGDLQFDVYRDMKEYNGNNWETFHPRTNVLWLHYLADKLVRSKRYQRNSREDQCVLRKFRLFLKEMLDYDSACELVTHSPFFSS